MCPGIPRAVELLQVHAIKATVTRVLEKRIALNSSALGSTGQCLFAVCHFLPHCNALNVLGKFCCRLNSLGHCGEVGLGRVRPVAFADQRSSRLGRGGESRELEVAYRKPLVVLTRGGPEGSRQFHADGIARSHGLVKRALSTSRRCITQVPAQG